MSASDVRAFLERHGLVAHRGLGQNFLCEPAVAERLAELAGVEAGDRVIEIGTGLGILTRALAARAERVVSLEVDAGLVRALRGEAALPCNVELVHADALRADLRALAVGAGRVRLVANLPYSISGPLLRRLLDLRDVLVDWSVMLQREVAARLLAGPGSADYGSLSVLHAVSVTSERVMSLAPGCFYPPPQVRSSFLRLRPLALPVLRPGELSGFEQLVRAAFGQRRKTLANALRGAELEGLPEPAELVRELESLGIEPRARAEQLAPERLLALSRRLAERAP